MGSDGRTPREGRVTDGGTIVTTRDLRDDDERTFRCNAPAETLSIAGWYCMGFRAGGMSPRRSRRRGRGAWRVGNW